MSDEYREHEEDDNECCCDEPERVVVHTSCAGEGGFSSFLRGICCLAVIAVAACLLFGLELPLVDLDPPPSAEPEIGTIAIENDSGDLIRLFVPDPEYPKQLGDLYVYGKDGWKELDSFAMPVQSSYRRDDSIPWDALENYLKDRKADGFFEEPCEDDSVSQKSQVLKGPVDSNPETAIGAWVVNKDGTALFFRQEDGK